MLSETGSSNVSAAFVTSTHATKRKSLPRGTLVHVVWSITSVSITTCSKHPKPLRKNLYLI